jgi:O-succinylbenzoic acid--CoA ligase
MRDALHHRLLADRPDARFWDGTTRGDLAAAIHEGARRYRDAGWSVGDRVAILPAADLATVTTILGALHAGLSVLVLPRREPPETRDSLAARAGARAAVAAGPGPDPPGQRLPGTLWIRSSGSLGQPRWVIHTPATLLAGATAAAAHLDFGPGARWQVSLPLDHVGGLSLVFRALAVGGALTSGDDATHLSLVATQLRRLLRGGADLSRHRCVLLGGGPVPTALRREALAAGTPLVVSYGLSETGAAISASDLDAPPDTLCRDHYAGRPLLPGSVDADQDGNLRVAGPALCVATAGDDGSPQPPPLADGWLATGDLGRLVGGELFVAGRRDNLIISGGEKLPAEELEAALLELDGVLEAVVVPVPDAEFGQRPAAFLRWDEGRERSLATVRAELAGVIAGWKRPVAIWELPDTGGLKPDRAGLRGLAAERR